MKKRIELSIIIVNHNGYFYTKKCYESIIKSSARRFEVIIVDNGSTKKEIDLLKKIQSKNIPVKLIMLNQNYGPSFARNVGFSNSTGKYICFLDNDTEVHPKWSSEAIKLLVNNPKVGIVQSKLLLSDDHKKIDYVGEYLGQNGFLVQRCPAGETDVGQYDKTVNILAAKSAGMFITRTAFVKAGGFDNDYFIYVEETDLGWRSWLKGYRAVYSPKSVVYHKFGTSSVILDKKINDFNAKFHGTKNYITTLIKNLELKSMFSILPVHVLLWLGLAWYSLFRGRYQSFIDIHKAFIWVIFNMSSILEKRRIIQSSRMVSDSDLFKNLMRKKNILYFVQKVTKQHKIGNAESFIKSK